MTLGVLQCLLKEATAGKPVLSLCERGDALIAEETGKVFKKEKEMKKGSLSHSLI